MSRRLSKTFDHGERDRIAHDQREKRDNSARSHALDSLENTASNSIERDPGPSAKLGVLHDVIGNSALAEHCLTKLKDGEAATPGLQDLRTSGGQSAQTTHRISKPSDQSEQEADQIANEVLSNASPAPVINAKLAHHVDEDSSAAAPNVDRVANRSGTSLPLALREEMEQKFGADFSDVQLHSDSEAQLSAKAMNANAYTIRNNIVFGEGQLSPESTEGRHLIAHELIHVVQQTDSSSSTIESDYIQRDATEAASIPTPEELLKSYLFDMLYDRFSGIATKLDQVVKAQASPFAYVQAVFKGIDSDWEDNLAAEFVSLQTEDVLDGFAKSEDGRAMLTMLYVAMITGDVTDFQRKQADRALNARTRATVSPEKYVKQSYRWAPDRPTPIFPVKFMRITPGHSMATPEAKLLSNGNVLVHYPATQHDEREFPEMHTLPAVFTGEGYEFGADEIVGIKQYEQGGEVVYLPALALIDYSNQCIQSTSGKIIEVSAIAASFGLVGPAEAVAEPGAWGARLALADRIATVVGIASIVIQENRDWIIRKFGPAGRFLVRTAEIANKAAAIYGFGRLGMAGVKLVSNLRNGTRALRSESAIFDKLDDAEKQVINRIDDETEALAKELDDAKVAEGGTSHVDEPGAQGAKSSDVKTASADDVPIAHGTVPAKISSRAWDDPLLSEDLAVDAYKRAGVKKNPLSDEAVRAKFKEGYRFDPETRRWKKPFKPPGTRPPRASTEPFMNDSLKKVSKQDHPLHKLVEEIQTPKGNAYDWRKTTRVTKSGKVQTGRYPGSETDPIVQAGHVDAYASGAPQKYVLEDADLNIVGGAVIESKGAFSMKVAVEVEGVWVELRSLQQWETLGVVPSGTVAKALKKLEETIP
jgi:hypothetical protein